MADSLPRIMANTSNHEKVKFAQCQNIKPEWKKLISLIHHHQISIFNSDPTNAEELENHKLNLWNKLKDSGFIGEGEYNRYNFYHLLLHQLPRLMNKDGILMRVTATRKRDDINRNLIVFMEPIIRFFRVNNVETLHKTVWDKVMAVDCLQVELIDDGGVKMLIPLPPAAQIFKNITILPSLLKNTFNEHKGFEDMINQQSNFDIKSFWKNIKKYISLNMSLKAQLAGIMLWKICNQKKIEYEDFVSHDIFHELGYLYIDIYDEKYQSLKLIKITDNLKEYSDNYNHITVNSEVDADLTGLFHVCSKCSMANILFAFDNTKCRQDPDHDIAQNYLVNQLIDYIHQTRLKTYRKERKYGYKWFKDKFLKNDDFVKSFILLSIPFIYRDNPIEIKKILQEIFFKRRQMKELPKF